MSNPRKQIILNEILFWKHNKLLPEHYCDFLMTLYSEGNGDETEETISHKKSVKSKETRKVRMLYLTTSIVAIILLIMLFTLDQLTLYISIIVGIMAVISIIGAIYIAKKHGFIAPLMYVFGALLIFGLSVKISLTYFEQNQLVLYLLLIGNCLLWLVGGILTKLIYFTISGVIGIIVLIIYKFIS